MSRVLVVGMSPLPGEDSRKSYAAGLRTWQFCTALQTAGHEVTLIACRIPFVDDEPFRTITDGFDRRLEVRRIDAPEDRLVDGQLINRLVAEVGADCVVGAHTHGSWLAVRAGPDVPVWCDLNGHLMAEAQTKAARYESDLYLDYFWHMEAAILDRGDVFSVATSPQYYATLGELGARGRLNRRTVRSQLVRVVPVAYYPARYHSPAGPIVRGVKVPEDAFVVLWSGSYNTWTDVDTLFNGLEYAMDADPTVYFVSTGGQVDGHDEITYPKFVQRASRSRFSNRFILEGWVSENLLPAYYAEADLAVNLDDHTVEAELGARNRILTWAVSGLAVATTTLCELAQELAERDLIYPLPTGEPEALAAAIATAKGDPQRRRWRSEATRTYITARFKCAHATLPLVEWCGQPGFAPDRGLARLPSDYRQQNSAAASVCGFIRRAASESRAHWRLGGARQVVGRAVRFAHQWLMPRRA
jgi:glycosyltransferase involved in cell wall biosynthesis